MRPTHHAPTCPSIGASDSCESEQSDSWGWSRSLSCIPSMLVDTCYNMSVLSGLGLPFRLRTPNSVGARRRVKSEFLEEEREGGLPAVPSSLSFRSWLNCPVPSRRPALGRRRGVIGGLTDSRRSSVRSSGHLCGGRDWSDHHCPFTSALPCPTFRASPLLGMS